MEEKGVLTKKRFTKEYRIKMTKDEQIVKAKMMFLALVYFKNSGSKRRDIIEKFEKEFKRLKLEPFNGRYTGSASTDEPEITLYAKIGRELNALEFDTEIKHYRSIVLHELIHKFLTNRDEDGNVKGTGLLKVLSRDTEFAEYIKTSKVNTIFKGINHIIMPSFNNPILSNEFGRGANEGYTEWFRKNVLKNDENMTYKELSLIFDRIQQRLENKNVNAIETMKNFGNGDYEYIFNTLNMSKEVGVLFVRVLDCIYMREYEKEEIKKYMDAKKYVEQLRRAQKTGKVLEDIEKYCADFESKIRQLKKFKKCKNDADIQNKLNEYITESDGKTKQLSEVVDDIMQKANDEREETGNKIEVSQINGIQTRIMGNVSGSKPQNKLTNFLSRIKDGVQGLFKKPKQEMLYEGKDEVHEAKIERKPKIKNTPATIPQSKKVVVKQNGVKTIINNMVNTLTRELENTSEILNTKNDNKIVFSKRERQMAIASIVLLMVFSLTNEFHAKQFMKSEMPNIMKSGEILQAKSINPENEGMRKDVGEYFANGIYLLEGTDVYRTSYKKPEDNAKVKYDYQNLCCDAVRITKDDSLIKAGELSDIDKLYKIGMDNDANVMMRVGVKNEDGTITYIAWCDVEEMIANIEKDNNDNKKVNDEGKTSSEHESELEIE